MTNSKNIWLKPTYLPYLQPELTDSIVEDAEKQIGFKLPKELIQLLKIQNGGYIRMTTENSLNEMIYGIGPHFPSLQRIDWTDYEEGIDYELNGLIPFDGDGHWYLCLDYRDNNNTPKITHIDVECNRQNIIAKTFAEYLGQLKVRVNDEFVMETDKSISKIVAELENILEIKFEEPDYFSHGFGQYRSKIKETWIWLSPNLVPNGFIRKNENRYDELIELSKGDALRFPELPENSLLINFSDENVANQLAMKLRANNIKIESIKSIIEN